MSVGGWQAGLQQDEGDMLTEPGGRAAGHAAVVASRRWAAGKGVLT